MRNLKIGQTVYLSPRNHSHETDLTAVTVKAIGRKWVTLSNGDKLEIGSTRTSVPNWSQDERDVYQIPEHYHEAKRLQNAWLTLRNFMDRRYTPPQEVTTERINQALQLLGYKPEEK